MEFPKSSGPVVKDMFNPGLWDTRTPFSVSIWAKGWGEGGRVLWWVNLGRRMEEDNFGLHAMGRSEQRGCLLGVLLLPAPFPGPGFFLSCGWTSGLRISHPEKTSSRQWVQCPRLRREAEEKLSQAQAYRCRGWTSAEWRSHLIKHPQ